MSVINLLLFLTNVNNRNHLPVTANEATLPKITIFLNFVHEINLIT